ncbi:MAG: PAS domain-containing protein [bacterium]
MKYKNKETNRVLYDKKLIYFGIGVGILFWFLEAAIHAFIFYHGNFIAEVFTPDGHEIWMRSLIVFLFVSFGIYAQSIVNSRKEAQEKAELASIQLNQIFKTVADGICMIDRFFRIVRVSQTFLNLFELSEDEVIGKDCYKVIPCSFCETPRCSLTQIWRDGKKRVEWSMQRKCKDGEKLSLNVVATPVLLPNGELVGIVNNFRCISDHALHEKHYESCY